MDLKLTNKNYVFLALIFLSIILWAYFLNETGLMLKEMLNLGELENVIGKLKSTAFLFFVFTFPGTIVSLPFPFRGLDKKQSKTISQRIWFKGSW